MSTIGNKIHSKIDEYATFIGSNLAKSGIIRIVVMLSFGIILAKDIAMTSGFLTVYGADMVIKVFIV